MEILGDIISIVYRNNENGYTIIKLLTKQGEVTASGKFPVVGEGEAVVLSGDFVNHPKYGNQFKAESVKISNPTSCDQIIKYLSCGLISGVGIVTATNIVDKFKEKTLQIIEEEPLRLSEIRGVSKEKAINIALRYSEIKKLQDAVIFLQRFDVSINMAVKIYNTYKCATEQILTKNPYKLVEDVDGIGFKTADKIAIKMGVEPDSLFRLRAGVVYCLKLVAERSGSTICDKQTLIQNACELLEIDAESKGEVFEQIIANLIIDGYVKELVEDDIVWYSLAKFYRMEKAIATKVNLLLSIESEKRNVDLEIEDYERINGITLHEQQRQAISLAINNNVSIITGGPGTGKTTIIKAINFILHKLGQKTLLLAPTGRASKRLSEATGEDAKTIHRALDINFKGAEYASMFNTATELEADAIIVDEFSMVDTFVMYNLSNAINMNNRLIIVGDKDQLPSVGAGNILDDFISTNKIPSISLTQIFRQSSLSNIITNAHKINNGDMVSYDNKSGDFFVLNKENPEDNETLVLDLVCTRLPQYLNIDKNNVQVLAPMKSGLLGVDNLNCKLQNTINPAKEGLAEVTLSSKLFRVGDRVMQTVNNYDKEWSRSAEVGYGVFNGDIGYIEDINPASSETTILFEDGRRCFYSIGEIDELMLSYAITIHKSQGSEFDAVVIPISSGNPSMLTRNLIYTAVTRAKKMVVIVGSTKVLYAMIKNNNCAKRYTMLNKLLLNSDLEL